MNTLIQKIRTLTDFILDSLFPLSPAEREILSMNPEKTIEILPPAPPTPVPNTHSVFHYKDERVQKLIWNIKYKKSRRGLAIASYILLQKLREFSAEDPNNIFMLIPIPITPKRRKERGYNQCELIIESILKIFTESDSQKFIYEKDLLLRKVHKDRQTLKNRSNRLEDAKGIFVVNESVAEKIRSEITRDIHIIVIDDVITTGSTIKEAMETLKKSGFKKVTGLSVAH